MGAGVPYADFGLDMRKGIAEANLPRLMHELAGWLRRKVWWQLQAEGAGVARAA